MSAKYIFDLHAHPSLKPSHQKPALNLWKMINTSSYCDKDKLPLFFRNVPSSLDTISQMNLAKWEAGNVRAVFFALYPVEKSLYDLRKITDLLVNDEKEINLGACVSTFDRSYIEQYIKEVKSDLPVNYFEELLNEFNYLNGQENIQDESGKFKIATDYAQFKNTLENEPDTFQAILTVEGLHSLLKFPAYSSMRIPSEKLNDPSSPEYQTYSQLLKENILTLKKWGDHGNKAPFFVTFCHHFWNLLAGQARSFSGVTRTFGYNQNFGINEPFTLLGKEVMKTLLDKSNGRRILIDTKHLGINARKDFYAIWKTYQQAGDPFPIISSHTCVNGLPSLDDPGNKNDTGFKNWDKYFNAWSINLYDEDIRNIFESKGMIGIFLHEIRMLGGIPKDRIDQYKKEGKMDLLRDEYIKVIMANIFHIIRTCNTKEAWDIVSMGTDNDGLIKTFETYNSGADQMVNLAQNMLQFLYRPIDIPEVNLYKADYQRLMFGYSPEELIDKIMYQNLENLLERYFHEDYLRGTNLIA